MRAHQTWENLVETNAGQIHIFCSARMMTVSIQIRLKCGLTAGLAQLIENIGIDLISNHAFDFRVSLIWNFTLFQDLVIPSNKRFHQLIVLQKVSGTTPDDVLKAEHNIPDLLI